MKKTLHIIMVALMLIATATSCSDEVLMEMNRPNSNVIQSDGTRITTLQNILPDAKPGYDGEGSRTSASWSEGDELLLKVNIKDGEDVAYTAWMTLQCTSNGTWKIKSGTTDKSYYYAQKNNDEIKNYGDLPLVTPAEGFTLSGEGNLEAITPEEITTPSLEVELIYAPDLEWKNSDSGIALGLKENPTTTAPEYWKVELKDDSTTEYEWKTTLARVCVKTGKAGEEVSLTSSSFVPLTDYKNENGVYTATTEGTDGIAYFYGTLSETTSDFKATLNTVMLDNKATVLAAPALLYKADPLNIVEFEAKNSYLIDGVYEGFRTQIENDAKPAVHSQETVEKDGVPFPKTMTVYGVNGLLEWVGLLNRDDGFAEIKLLLANDIVLPQLQIKSKKNENGTYTYYYEEPTDDNWSNWEPVGGDFGGQIEPSESGKHITISGMRLNNEVAFVNRLITKEGCDDASIKNLYFVDAEVVHTSASAAVIVHTNEGLVEGCVVANSSVQAINAVGTIAVKNEGTIQNCENRNTDVISNNQNDSSQGLDSELVGGIVGHNEKNGFVTNCINSGKVVSHGSRGHNFTGGIAGHSYGDIFYCENSGSVEGSTNGSSKAVTYSEKDMHISAVGGIVGNCSYGKIVGCINSGAIKGNTGSSSNSVTTNRVGGIVGYSGHKTYVVACGNTGTLSINNEANQNYAGGLVAVLGNYVSEDKGENAVYGKVYGSWTVDTIEKYHSKGTNTDASSKDGFGTGSGNDNVTGCKSFADVSEVNAGLTEINDAITTYNGISEITTERKSAKQWQVGNGWLELTDIN